MELVPLPEVDELVELGLVVSLVEVDEELVKLDELLELSEVAVVQLVLVVEVVVLPVVAG